MKHLIILSAIALTTTVLSAQENQPKPLVGEIQKFFSTPCEPDTFKAENVKATTRTISNTHGTHTETNVSASLTCLLRSEGSLKGRFLSLGGANLNPGKIVIADATKPSRYTLLPQTTGPLTSNIIGSVVMVYDIKLSAPITLRTNDNYFTIRTTEGWEEYKLSFDKNNIHTFELVQKLEKIEI